MANPVTQGSHNRVQRFDADFLVCRRLHVEEGFTFDGDLTLNDIFCNNLTATNTVTSNNVVTNTITVPTIVGVITINGQPYPPPATNSLASGGPLIDVANGAVFPTLIVPAGGTGAYRVTNASLAGMANNAPDPGPGNGGPGGAGLARITGFGGDIATRTELLLFNASGFVLRFFTPIVSINVARGRVWWPGTRARATRASTATTTWVVEVDDLRFASTLLEDVPTFTPRITLQPGSTLVEAQFEYSLHGYSDATTDNVQCVMEGVHALRLDRTGNPAANTARTEFVVPVGEDATNNWTPVVGFHPSFGLLNQLQVRVGGTGAFQLPPYRHVGSGHIMDQAPSTYANAHLRADGNLHIDLEMLGVAGLADVTPISAFRFMFDRYAYVATF